VTTHRTKSRTRSTPSRNGRHLNDHTATAAPAVTPPQGEHGPDGRWQPGNRAGCCNPFHRQTAERRRALLAAVTDQDVADVARQLLRQALAGDTAASKVLLTFVIGKSAAAADPDGVDGDEVRRRLQQPLDVELILHSVNGVSISEALKFLRGVETAKAGKPLTFMGDGDDDDEDGVVARLAAVLRQRERVLTSRAAKE
jgi:hypothetical protein